MFRKVSFFTSKEKGFSWWWLGVKLGVVTALILWWWLDNQKRKSAQQLPGKTPSDELQSIPLPVEEPPLAEAVPDETPEKSAAPPAQPDDLRKIEGIGPKIHAALQEAGITTFVQLAGSEPAALKQILVDAGIRIGYPDTWPEQAALAAKADWAGLKEFQSALQGGRRIA